MIPKEELWKQNSRPSTVSTKVPTKVDLSQCGEVLLRYQHTPAVVASKTMLVYTQVCAWIPVFAEFWIKFAKKHTSFYSPEPKACAACWTFGLRWCRRPRPTSTRTGKSPEVLNDCCALSNPSPKYRTDTIGAEFWLSVTPPTANPHPRLNQNYAFSSPPPPTLHTL